MAANRGSRVLAPVKRAVANMVARAVLNLIDDGKGIQALQIGILNGETRDEVERFQDFGFSSTPVAGAEAVVVFVGGNRDHPLVVKVDDRRYRFKANAGGAALYDASGSVVHMKNDGTVEIIAATRLDITSPLVRMSGDLEVAGDITDRYETNPNTINGMRQIYDTHTHDETNSVTQVPNQLMG